MFFPVISAWMKKLYDSARFRIDRGKIRPFMPIAVKASQGKVFRGGGPAMLDVNDVIGFVTRNISFGHETVFAPSFGTSVDESEQRLRDIAHDWAGRCCQARALMSAKRWFRDSMVSNSASSSAVRVPPRFFSSNLRTRLCESSEA